MKYPKQNHTLCAGCYRHRALFRYRGEVRADHDHTLCFRCWRAAIDRLAAMILLSNPQDEAR